MASSPKPPKMPSNVPDYRELLAVKDRPERSPEWVAAVKARVPSREELLAVKDPEVGSLAWYEQVDERSVRMGKPALRAPPAGQAWRTGQAGAEDGRRGAQESRRGGQVGGEGRGQPGMARGREGRRHAAAGGSSSSSTLRRGGCTEGLNHAGPNPTELLASAAFLLASADQLPASDPRKGSACYRRSRNSWIGRGKGSACTADLGAQ
jgi:hypothetical protein